MDIRLSIVIAVYSETDSLAETIRRLLAKDRGYIHEIILVLAPASSPECFALCRRLEEGHGQIRVMAQKRNPGVGLAFRDGFEMVTGTHTVMMAADLETEPEAVDRMAAKVLETGADAVAPSRWTQGGGFKDYGRLRTIANYVFQRFFMVLFNTPVSDLTFGFKLFKTDFLRRLSLQTEGPELALECILKMLRSGARIEQVPAVWIRRPQGKSKNTSDLSMLARHLKTGSNIYFSFHADHTA